MYIALPCLEMLSTLQISYAYMYVLQYALEELHTYFAVCKNDWLAMVPDAFHTHILATVCARQLRAWLEKICGQ